MLVLNTNLYYDQNKLTLDMDDPAGQFSWADRVLTEAASNKEKAKHLVELWDFHFLLSGRLLIRCHILISIKRAIQLCTILSA